LVIASSCDAMLAQVAFPPRQQLTDLPFLVCGRRNFAAMNR
jgi:hypothetical protein